MIYTDACGIQATGIEEFQAQNGPDGEDVLIVLALCVANFGTLGK